MKRKNGDLSDNESDGGHHKSKKKQKKRHKSDSDQDEDDESAKRTSKREKNSKHDKKEKKHKKHKKERQSEKEKIFELEKARLKADLRIETSVWLTEDNAHKVYFFDLTGDHNNLLFGNLHRKDVAIYERQKFCLGLDKSEGITVVWRASNPTYLVFKREARDNVQRNRYHASKNVILLQEKNIQR